MPDPVAWTLIERGWNVVDAGGAKIGRVDEVVGDENIDIFDGLAISGRKYVPSEQVGTIYEGEIHLTVRGDTLADYTAPAVEESIIPEPSTWLQRFADMFRGPRR